MLVDFQNDFVSPEGKLPVTNVQSFLSSLPSLVAEFRAKGEVIWAGTEYKQPRSSISLVTGSHAILLKQFLNRNETQETSDFFNDPISPRSPRKDPLSPSPSPHPDISHDREAYLGPVPTPTEHRCCMPGSAGAEYPNLIQTAIDSQRDLVILKSHYSAFEGTSLLMHLRTRLITHLYVCGSLSNISVYATVLDAVCNGLQVTVVEDCLGYNEEACHIEAMRQMADHMGANGVECQELRDDLAGLLGDVVREEDFPTKLRVSLRPPARKTRSHISKDEISNWVSALEGEGTRRPSADVKATPSKQSGAAVVTGDDPKIPSESFQKSETPSSNEHSPPQKRSTRDLDPPEEDRMPKSSHKPSARRTSNIHAEQVNQKQTKPSNRKRRPSHQPSIRSLTPAPEMVRSRSAGTPPGPKEESSESDQTQGPSTDAGTNRESLNTGPKKKKKITPNVLGPSDEIGQGDSRLTIDLLSQAEAEEAFYSCRQLIKWQKMFHRSGEVPRLVAVQGAVSGNGSQIPIYRHPADESPELLPFDPHVDMLRRAAEKVVGHPLNHVLIQWYRNSEDNISEHSDKTLDIVRGSSIVNLSLGAQRTMILRTKKSTIQTDTDDRDAGNARSSQRILLPHNSLFILGQETNQHWLHAIRADKRPLSEKTPGELAFEGERISLTFRNIGTFIDPIHNTIWGQGATSKEKTGATKLLSGAEAEKQGEAMIRAFGQENHRSTDWNWSEWYGKGFDVVNFETKIA